MELDWCLSFSGTSVAILVAILVLLVTKAFQWPSDIPPGPRGYPIVGSTPLLRKGRVPETYRKLRAKYGDVFSLKIGSQLQVVINGPEALRESFVKQSEDFSDRPVNFFITELLRKRGILASSGEHWKQTRTFALTALRDFGFGRRSLENHILEEVEEFIKLVADQNGQLFDPSKSVRTSVSNIICSIVFGERFEYTDARFQRLLRTLTDLFKLSTVSSFLNLLPWLRKLPGDLFKFKLVSMKFNDILRFIQEEIERHRNTYNEDNIRDFIDAFLKEQGKQSKENAVFSDFNVKVTVLNLFAAGTETTTTAIRWAILYLLHRKDIQSKLRKEIETVVGASRFPSLNDKPDMPYYEAFITEVLRAGNIVPLGLPHGASHNIRFRGMTIPKGSIIIGNLDSVLFDPEVFEEPEKFNPDRFLGHDGKLNGKEKLVMAFSLGRRVCLGETLARMEIFLFMTSLLQKFELVPEDPNNLPSLKHSLGFTNTPEPYTFRAVKII